MLTLLIPPTKSNGISIEDAVFKKDVMIVVNFTVQFQHFLRALWKTTKHGTLDM